MEDEMILEGEPEVWFNDKYDKLYDLAINHDFKGIPQHVKVYFVLHTMFDEVMNGGFGQFITNSSGKLSKYLLECSKILNNTKLIFLIRKVCTIIGDKTNNLTSDDYKKLEKLSDDFFDIEDEENLYDLLDDYYENHAKTIILPRLKITKKTFIKDFTKLVIEQGEMFDDIHSDRRMVNKLANRICKYIDYLADNTEYAKIAIDILIKNNNYYVQNIVASLLWDFEYRKKDCITIYKKLINDRERKNTLLWCVILTAYEGIITGTYIKRRKYPKLD